VSFAALWLAVGVLGGLVALARFALDGAVSNAAGGRFPLGTLVVNMSGAIVLGALVGAALSGHAYLLAGTAVVGSYTTFSTWMLETHRLGEDGRVGLLVANLAVSTVAGLAAVEAGRLLAGG
jgi:fluoride exporter